MINILFLSHQGKRSKTQVMLPMTKQRGIIRTGWSPSPTTTDKTIRDFSVRIHQIFRTETQGIANSRQQTCVLKAMKISLIPEMSVVVCTRVWWCVP